MCLSLFMTSAPAAALDLVILVYGIYSRHNFCSCKGSHFKIIPIQHIFSSVNNQCDQMARLLFQYLVIYNIENLPNNKRNLPKHVQNFVLNGRFKICQSCLKFYLSGKIWPNVVMLYLIHHKRHWTRIAHKIRFHVWRIVLKNVIYLSVQNIHLSPL